MSSQPDRILVFIPAYNCAPQIGRVLMQFEGVPAGRFQEILVLDNRSKDGTVEAAMQTAAQVTHCPVTIGRNKANYNLGGSHKAAFAYAAANAFTHVVVLHGDDQGLITDLLPVLDRADHNRFDACLGSRFARGSRLQGYSRFRIFGNHVFNSLFSVVSVRRITDLGSGLNIFAKRLFSDPAVTLHADDLRFNNYLLLGMIDRNLHFMFFPISWREDDQVSNVKMMSQSINTLKILLQYAVKRNRFRHDDHRYTTHDQYDFDVVTPPSS